MAVAGHTLLDYHYLGRLSTIRGTIKRHMKFNNHNQLIGKNKKSITTIGSTTITLYTDNPLDRRPIRHIHLYYFVQHKTRMLVMFQLNLEDKMLNSIKKYIEKDS